MTPVPRTFPACIALLGAALVASPARAGDVELEAAAGATTYASTWRGDVGAGGTLRGGARFSRLIAVDVQVWESMATVNERVNTGLSVGVAGYLPLPSLHPFARLFAIHQHEEGLVSVAATPLGFVFGIGSGIRHRAGGGLSLGAELPVRGQGERLGWTIFGEATGTYFPDATLGPAAYVGLDLGVGVDFLLQ